MSALNEPNYSTIEKSSQKKKRNRIAELLISIKEILNGKLHLFVQCNGQNCKTWRKCYVLYYDKLTSYLKSSLCSHVRATDPKMVQEIIAKSTSEERNICSSWFWHLICCYQKSFLTLWVTVYINLRLPSLVFDKKNFSLGLKLSETCIYFTHYLKTP